MSCGQPRKYMTCQLIIGQSRHRMLSGGAVRRNSLRCAPFGPPTVSCVLASARTCLRQAPPTSRGRGLATSAVPHHLADDTSIKAFTRGKRCEISPFFTPFCSQLGYGRNNSFNPRHPKSERRSCRPEREGSSQIPIFLRQTLSISSSSYGPHRVRVKLF